ncbi:hypothetical protein B932_1946 [Gluconobacter oxydans H24]|nr:hypothetical protein B932_1946 [Gluconobacter oxydans H24]
MLPDGKNVLSAERHSLVKGLCSYGNGLATATTPSRALGKYFYFISFC